MENQINTQQNQQQNKKGFFSTTKRKVLFSLAVFLFLTASFAGVSFAKRIYNIKTEGPIGMIIDKITDDINLSESQKLKIAALKSDIKLKMDSKKSGRKEKFESFINEFKKDNLDKAALENMYKQNESEKNEMKEFAENKIIEFHSILTSEQRHQAADKLMKLKEKFHDKMEHFHGEK